MAHNRDISNAQALHQSALEYWENGYPQETESHLKAALEALPPKSTHPHRDRLSVEIKSDLARLYASDIYRPAQAEMLYKEALFFANQQLGAQDLLTALIMNNLACLYYNEKQFELAESYFKKVLDIVDRKPSPDKESLPMYLYNYAMTLQTLGRNDEAKKYFRRTNWRP